MRFISVRDLRTTPAQIWKNLPEEKEMVITNNGRPIALLTPISDENFEDTIKSIRKARAINALKKLQYDSVKLGKNTITENEIQEEITKYRKERKK